MRKAILIGRKGDKEKPISDVILHSEARQHLRVLRGDSKAFKDLEAVILQPVGVAGAKTVVKAVVAANEKRNEELAKEAAEKAKEDKPVKESKAKKAAAALVAAMAMLFVFNASAQQEIKGQLYSTTLNGTNANNSAALQWNPDDILSFQAYVTTTYDATADTNDITMTLDESLGAGYWKAATKTVTIDCGSTTNGSITLFRITNNFVTKCFRITQLERPDNGGTNTVTVNSLLMHKPD